jgi:hypothetical protein
MHRWSAFLPPPAPTWRLDGVSATMSNPDLFVARYVRREAVMSEATRQAFQARDVSASAFKLLDHLFLQPVTTVNAAKDALGVSQLLDHWLSPATW